VLAPQEGVHEGERDRARARETERGARGGDQGGADAGDAVDVVGDGRKVRAARGEGVAFCKNIGERYIAICGRNRIASRDEARLGAISCYFVLR